MMGSYEKHRLTVLRCIDLLMYTETGDLEWRVETLRNHVRAHLRALTAPKKRRTKRKARK